MKSIDVYAYNQEEAKSECRKRKPGYVPVKAKKVGTKHNMSVYQVWYRKRK